jgi:hypothetical protein
MLLEFSTLRADRWDNDSVRDPLNLNHFLDVEAMLAFADVTCHG